MYWEYLLPEYKQSMIHKRGQQAHNPLDKTDKEDRDIYPNNGVWLIDQVTFSVALTMFLLNLGVAQSCFGVAMTWCLFKDWIWISREIHKDQFKISKELKVYAKHDQVLWWKKDKDVVDDNTNYRGARMVISNHEFDSHLGRSQNVDDDHNTIHREVSWRCNWTVTWSNRKKVKQKVNGTIDISQGSVTTLI